MSTALNIAEERLAKGEITKEEFEGIKAALSEQKEGTQSSVTQEPHTQAEQVGAPRQQYQAPLKQLVDLRDTAKFLKFLIQVCAAISFVYAIMILKNSSVEAKFSRAKALETDMLFLSVSAIPLLLMIVVFLYWKKKSTDNLFILKGPQSVTPAGAVYWYFVPVAWFWKPYEAMRNLANGFGIAHDKSWTLPFWWSVFWGSFAFTMFAAFSAPAVETVTTVKQASLYANWSIFIYLVDAGSYMAALWIVDAVSDAQEKTLTQATS
jgi:uncharacterized membrane protein